MSHKARITPGPFESALGLLGAVVFIVITQRLLGSEAGSFGMLFLLAGLGAVAFNAYNLFSEHGIAERVVHFDKDPSWQVPEPTEQPVGPDPAQRLERLESLRERELISEDEYDAQRQRILTEL